MSPHACSPHLARQHCCRFAQGRDWFKTSSTKRELTVPLSSPSLRACPTECDIVLTSMSDDDALEEIFVELFAGQESKKALPDSAYPGGRGKPSLFIDTSVSGSALYRPLRPSRVLTLDRLSVDHLPSHCRPT